MKKTNSNSKKISGRGTKPSESRSGPDTRRKKSQKNPQQGGKNGPKRPSPGSHVDIYGLHAVRAALLNPRRHIHKIFATTSALEKLEIENISLKVQPEIVDGAFISKMLHEEAVHQGCLIQASPLPTSNLKQYLATEPENGLLIALDQVTDPHNVGAILRSAAFFGVKGLILTNHHSPPFTGVLAKAACGGLENVDLFLVSNLARSLEMCRNHYFEVVGLAGEGDTLLNKADVSSRTLLVMGSEEKGMRRLTRENCDTLCRISTESSVTSLNVSNAAAVALFHFSKSG